MLKRIKYILPILVIIFSGCEQIIDLDLNDARPALVIEADLSSPDGLLTVNVSQTGSYFTPDSVQKIDNASVYLINPKGIQKTANAMGNGIYELNQILIKPGDKFKLIVEVDGEQYIAESAVMPPVEIDSISYSYYEGDNFFRPGYRFNISFSDPPGIKNYYRIKAYSETFYFHNRPHDLVVFNDTDLDGKTIAVQLQSQYFMDPGETAIFELLSIDRQAWEYFTTFNDLISAGPGSPAPANPVSSFNNNAQGYFYAWSYSRKSVTIKE
jgi:hypothetical protein